MVGEATGFRGFSDKVVEKRTGRSTEEWNRLLDDWGAAKKGHARTAKYLVEEHGVSRWWAQAVTIRYQDERGLGD